jgi:hypothetical protein
LLKPLYFICHYQNIRKANCESDMRQQEKYIVAGRRNKPPSACRNSVRFITYECKIRQHCWGKGWYWYICNYRRQCGTDSALDCIRKGSVWVSAAGCPPLSPLPNALSVLQLSTTLDSFRDELGRAIIKIHDTKKVKYNIQHYCTAVANRRYCTDRN